MNMNLGEDGDIWYPFPTETLECPVESDIDLSKLLPQTNSKIFIDIQNQLKNPESTGTTTESKSSTNIDDDKGG